MWLEKVFFNFQSSNLNSISDERSADLRVPLRLFWPKLCSLWFNSCSKDKVIRMDDDVHGLKASLKQVVLYNHKLHATLLTVTYLWTDNPLGECVWIKLIQVIAQMNWDFSLSYSSRWLSFNIDFLKLCMEKEETERLWFKHGSCIIMQPTISSNMEN